MLTPPPLNNQYTLIGMVNNYNFATDTDGFPFIVTVQIHVRCLLQHKV
ncbi:hypothetical protein [Photobacterium angustum]|nr:hypothetical protein [Photobacterium angustum]